MDTNDMRTTRARTAHGTGNLTAARVRDLLNDVPDSAIIRVMTEDPDRGQGEAWHFYAMWDDS